MCKRPINHTLGAPITHAFGRDRIPKASGDESDDCVLLSRLLGNVGKLAVAVEHTHDPVIDRWREVAFEEHQRLVPQVDDTDLLVTGEPMPPGKGDAELLAPELFDDQPRADP